MSCRGDTDVRNAVRADMDNELQELLTAVVKPYDLIGIGGMMLYRRPVAVCGSLARRGVPVSVVTFSAGYETELLAAAGVLHSVRTCYAGLEVFGPAPLLRQAVESGEVAFVDETELTLAAGLQAAVLAVPWLPVARGVVGTDYETVRDDLRVVGEHRREPLLGLPAIAPDVCLVHVPYADPVGNALLLSSPSLDRQLVAASGTVVVTADHVVTSERLAELGPVELFAFEVDHVVEVPSGSAPTSCFPHYSYDGFALLDHLEEHG